MIWLTDMTVLLCDGSAFRRSYILWNQADHREHLRPATWASQSTCRRHLHRYVLLQSIIMTVCLSVLCIMIGERWRRVWGTRPWSYDNMNVISISNTPHASRSPALPLDLISDQFAYRPTASTTAALISLTHAVAQKLESCNYVRCLQVDYAKAFWHV